MTNTPTNPGYFWARWIAVEPGTRDETDFEPHRNWEVVQVFQNASGAMHPDWLRVFVPGVERSQPLGNFDWGPAVPSMTHSAETHLSTISCHAKLTRFEHQLLLELARAPAWLSRDDILDALYGHERDLRSRHVVNVRIHHMRKKLEPLGIRIENLHGRGYRLDMSEPMEKAA